MARTAEKRKLYRVFGGGRLNENVCFEQAILEWILKEKNVKALTAFIWLKIGKSGPKNRLTDRHDEANSRFLMFCKLTKKSPNRYKNLYSRAKTYLVRLLAVLFLCASTFWSSLQSRFFPSRCDNISKSKWHIESGRKCEAVADFYLHISDTRWPLLLCSRDSKLLGLGITNETLKC